MKISCFKIGEDLFGVDILLVKEIASITEIVKIPGANSYHCGLMNLRGNVVSLLHPELFTEDLSPIDPKKHKVVIFKNNEGIKPLVEQQLYEDLDLGNDIIGLIIDSISDVIEVEPSELRELSQNVSPKLNSVLDGVINIDNQLALVISLPKMLSDMNKGRSND